MGAVPLPDLSDAAASSFKSAKAAIDKALHMPDLPTTPLDKAEMLALARVAVANAVLLATALHTPPPAGSRTAVFDFGTHPCFPLVRLVEKGKKEGGKEGETEGEKGEREGKKGERDGVKEREKGEREGERGDREGEKGEREGVKEREKEGEKGERGGGRGAAELSNAELLWHVCFGVTRCE